MDSRLRGNDVLLLVASATGGYGTQAAARMMHCVTSCLSDDTLAVVLLQALRALKLMERMPSAHSSISDNLFV
jgi:hypothetical protein